jgi:uncharacterized protein
MAYRFKKENDIAYISILYTFIVFVFSIGMTAISGLDFYRSGVIGEFVFLLLPALLFVELGIARGKKEFLRLNKIKVSTGVTISLLILFSLPVFGFINNLVYFMFARIFGAVEIYSSPVPKDIRELILSLIILALVPALCEEFLFRGVIQGALRRQGHIFSIVLTGVLFSFLHLDIQKFIGIALLGSLIGYIVYRTNSLYAGMLAHFVNNALAVAVSYFFVDYSSVSAQEIQRIPKESYSLFVSADITSIVSTIILAVIFGVLFIFVFARFIKATSVTREVSVAMNFDRSSKGYLFLLPAVAFIVFLYVIQSNTIISGSGGLLDLIASSFYYKP